MTASLAAPRTTSPRRLRVLTDSGPIDGATGGHAEHAHDSRPLTSTVSALPVVPVAGPIPSCPNRTHQQENSMSESRSPNLPINGAFFPG